MYIYVYTDIDTYVFTVCSSSLPTRLLRSNPFTRLDPKPRSKKITPHPPPTIQPPYPGGPQAPIQKKKPPPPPCITSCSHRAAVFVVVCTIQSASLLRSTLCKSCWLHMATRPERSLPHRCGALLQIYVATRNSVLVMY